VLLDSARPGPVIVGVAGGSGSGKTTVARSVHRRLGPERAALVAQDSYYRVVDWSSAGPPERYNFDHPDALDVELLVEHLDRLRRGLAVDVPVYDFTTHRRGSAVVRLQPRAVVVVDGTLILALPEVRRQLDLKVFVDVAADLRFIRRLRRDVTERCRSMEGTVAQYLDTVRPMHEDWVEPSRLEADVVVPEGGHNTNAMDTLLSRVEAMLAVDGPG